MKAAPVRYKTARTVQQMCGLLGIDTAAFLRRMRFAPDYFENEGKGVTATELFEGWSIMVEMSGRDDLPLYLGQAYARGPFNAAFFSFTCSPDVRTGLERLSVFKPLVGPFRLILKTADDGGLEVSKSSTLLGGDMPLSFAATEMVFLVDAIRTCTAQPFVPRAAFLPARLPCHEALEEFVGCSIGIGPSRMVLSPEDANRRLLSFDPDHWASLEPAFRQQLLAVQSGTTMTERTRAALMQMLPSGANAVSDAAAHLRLSTRSLQRHLRTEGTSYQRLLDDVRHDMALRYLERSDLTIDEISYLLAYRDPNSFYRAFQGWSGMTPSAARSRAGQS